MKSIQKIIFILITSFFIGCSQNESVKDFEADIAAIEELSAIYGTVVSEGDVDNYIKLFTEDAILMPADQEIVIGKENILIRAQSKFGAYKDKGLEEVTTPHEIKVYGNWAYDLGLTTFKTRDNPTPYSNKYIRIWEKQSEGSWKLSRVIWNSNKPT